jgi:predicted HicB family RNase H-like nuclease
MQQDKDRQVRIDAELARSVAIEAAKRGTSRKALVRDALLAYLKTAPAVPAAS